MFYRDNQQLRKDLWLQLLDQDIAVVEAKHDIKIKDAVYFDVNRGLDTVVNQHVYTQINTADEQIVVL